MAPPQSYESALLSALKDYLSDKSTDYVDSNLDGSIDWDYFSEVHSPALNPKGAIAINQVTPQQPRADIRATPIKTEYQVVLRLTVSLSGVSAFEAQLIVTDWQALLLSWLYDLRQSGITGTYRGKNLANAFLGLKVSDRIPFPVVKPYQRTQTDQPEGITETIGIVFTWVKDA